MPAATTTRAVGLTRSLSPCPPQPVTGEQCEKTNPISPQEHRQWPEPNSMLSPSSIQTAERSQFSSAATRDSAPLAPARSGKTNPISRALLQATERSQFPELCGARPSRLEKQTQCPSKPIHSKDLQKKVQAPQQDVPNEANSAAGGSTLPASRKTNPILGEPPSFEI